MARKTEIGEDELDAMADAIARGIVAVCECAEPGVGRWKAFLAAFDHLPRDPQPADREPEPAGASAAAHYPASAETADQCHADLMANEL
jgi:hypothetical protein